MGACHNQSNTRLWVTHNARKVTDCCLVPATHLSVYEQQGCLDAVGHPASSTCTRHIGDTDACLTNSEPPTHKAHTPYSKQMQKPQQCGWRTSTRLLARWQSSRDCFRPGLGLSTKQIAVSDCEGKLGANRSFHPSLAQRASLSARHGCVIMQHH